MSSNLTPHEPFTLRQTNVSNPSIIHSKPSQQSIAASEDYYSFSASSSSRAPSIRNHDNNHSQHTVTRSQTPPSRYRTPQHSREVLSAHPRDPLSSQRPAPDQTYARGQARSQPVNPLSNPEVARPAHQHVAAEHADPDAEQRGRKTPMRGEGRRRSSASDNPRAALLSSGAPPSPQAPPRGPRSATGPTTGPNPRTRARSSAAMDLDRSNASATPGVDDTPFIRFALEQLTLDEEVRGSRSYGNIPVPAPRGSQPAPALSTPPSTSRAVPNPRILSTRTAPWPRRSGSRTRDPDEDARLLPPTNPPQNLLPHRAAAAAAAAATAAGSVPGSRTGGPPPALPPPPRDFREQGPDVFVPATIAPVRPPFASSPPALNFVPAILRPIALGLFLAVLAAWIAALVVAAVWSVADTGLWDYGSFGDGRYFVFRFLPSMLGLGLWLWLLQIEGAVFRVAPFVALSSHSVEIREEGAGLLLARPGFVLPYLGHFRAGQALVGAFVLMTWLQVFQLPLLAGSFNVYFLGPPDTGRWRWIATQGVIWTVIALYVLLFAAVVWLGLWMHKRMTGLKWDPECLADIVILLERSNALDPEDEVGRLGYWTTTHRPNEMLHTFGIADKEARRYEMGENGQLREKASAPGPITDPTRSSAPGPPSRSSELDPDLEVAGPRASRDAILPSSDPADAPRSALRSRADDSGPLPWFLWPSFALLWPCISLVLLLAFLIVSYLPSTHLLSPGFEPGVPAPVNSMGFSSINFLYSFIPSLLGMLCLLFILSIEHAYRRLQPLANLSTSTGAIAERTLLTSYPADFPGITPVSAGVNRDWKLVVLSAASILSLPIPILAGGVFWAQFEVAGQRTLVTTNATAFYALTVFVTLHAIAYLWVFPPRSLRNLPPGVGIDSFADVRRLVAQSRLLTDLAFRAPETRTQLVTRLLAPWPGVYLGQKSGNYNRTGESRTSVNNLSRVSLADGVRGFGRARPPPVPGAGAEEKWNALPRYAFGRHVGRDGKEFVGVDRVRN